MVDANGIAVGEAAAFPDLHPQEHNTRTAMEKARVTSSGTGKSQIRP
jgi:hypothetical protein